MSEIDEEEESKLMFPKCPFCGQVFDSVYNLKSHIRMWHL
jgi:uncharacterized C2H2 Zn-finger protein